MFFDPGKFNLRPRAIEIIALVASDDKILTYGHITVSGDIDTAEVITNGTTLSSERASAVRTQLIADGVAPNKISIIQPGPLLVPTGPNVSLAQNRNVFIQGDKLRYGLPLPPDLQDH